MSFLDRLIHKDEKLVIGLISGTSMDGVDAALVHIHGSGLRTEIAVVGFQTYPYPTALRNRLLQLSQPGAGSVDEICRLNFVVAEYFADAVFELCGATGVSLREVDLIGSHGQTIHHLPHAVEYFRKPSRSTLQIGEPAVIANRTGIVTVANFRSADMAQGGEGAPLVPYFDYLMFRSAKLNRVILNIGGIANVTILPADCGRNDVLAFDTGPGNMVIDGLMQQLYQRQYDADGAVARTGRIATSLLQQLLAHPYFQQPAPKSTGREDFGAHFMAAILDANKKWRLPAEDLIATATELTAVSIAESLRFSQLALEKVDEWIVSGGGSHNQALMAALARHAAHSKIWLTDDFRIPVDAKEAICFAVLANETMSGHSANLPSVTGAKGQAILGTICPVMPLKTHGTCPTGEIDA
ncbi:MAG: anhydro-N-acetylmuramic acid kinase [candidate division KSB1 bacterium]|nr:anhydro-N-acetylmuramic acid kinase [candidate division KSB1 bacterium]MDZ7340501.1 anhydro-N-acetylmuramic acid kinase [candidate division KSB1 bacterium]